MKTFVLVVASLVAMSASTAWASTSSNFGNSGLSGPFTDDYSFTTGAGDADVTLSTSSAGLSLTNVTFDGQALTEYGVYGPDAFYGLTDVAVSAGPQTLNVSGTFTGSPGSSGSYDGTLTFTPVSGAPEPSSWALMIFGVGMAGGMLRFGRRHASLAAA